jgi:nitrite reductase/ring-hydroxylating ferredoxin subunit/uncharacterized membrane protein
MRSAAHFRGHPIHAVLVPFPLAFLIGAFVFDVGGVLLNQPGLWRTGSHLAAAGIVTALFAAIPGFIDYVRAVPPQSSGRERATTHMLLNLTTVAVFAVAVALRGFTAREPGLLPLVLEGLGALMLSFSGWMGGTLVVRNQIGVDHRYADAGRWKDQSVETGRGKPVVVAGVDELKVNQMKLLRVNGKRIVLARTEAGYRAFSDGCTHKGGSLADGAMICGTVQCPWHGSQFDAATGAVKAGPAKQGIDVYTVRERDGQVLLDVSS